MNNLFFQSSLAFLLVSVLLLTSCSYFISSEENEKAVEETILNRVATDKDEAKLLVLASKQNLDVIALCSIIEERENQIEDTVIDLVENLKEDQILISEKFNEVATENVISIPDYSELNNKSDTSDTTIDLVSQLKRVEDKLMNQIQLLKQLSATTNNIEFMLLVKDTNKTLYKNLNKTTETLEALQSDS